MPLMSSSKLFSRHPTSLSYDGLFDYRFVIRKLNYLEKSSRPVIAYTMHQCARFTVDPKQEHTQAISWLGRYLKFTSDKGIILNPKEERQIEVPVDADFVGNWNKEKTDDMDTSRYQHGYVIKFEGCPVTWKSQLKTEVCLATTECEYTGLSYTLREAIPLIELVNEMKKHVVHIENKSPKVFCGVFEDNSEALEITRTHKYKPRPKHLNYKLHYFMSYVESGEITIYPISTTKQPTNIYTKPMNEEILVLHCMDVMAW